jgi:DNA-binding GntR family transcriptional regulator
VELSGTLLRFPVDHGYLVSSMVTGVTYIPPWEPSATKYLYVQVADHLEARIEAGEWQPGARLPPERDLARDYGVAFHTVRRATERLRERGRIVTMHGLGTFIPEP